MMIPISGEIFLAIMLVVIGAAAGVILIGIAVCVLDRRSENKTKKNVKPSRRKNMERRMFACGTCLNAGTPVCEECHVIEKPSGSSTRPTHYCGDNQNAAGGLSPGDVSAILLVRLQCGKPLPLKWVMRYNEYCVREAVQEEQCDGTAGDV